MGARRDRGRLAAALERHAVGIDPLIGPGPAQLERAADRLATRSGRGGGLEVDERAADAGGGRRAGGREDLPVAADLEAHAAEPLLEGEGVAAVHGRFGLVWLRTHHLEALHALRAALRETRVGARQADRDAEGAL